jgi:hypothetical protein
VGFDDLGQEKSPVTLQPKALPGRCWGCFLAGSELPERGRARHLVASVQSLTVPCPNSPRLLTTVLRFIPESGNYSCSADIPFIAGAGDGFNDSPRQESFRRCLIDSIDSAADSKDGVGLHRFDEPPLSPNDSARHPNSRRG